MSLASAVLSGNRLQLARLITAIEDGTPEGINTLDELFQYTGKAHLIGITGSPGSGKSTLLNQLVQEFRKPPDGKKALTVAVVAVDPTSPFSGGAILGDRVRMRDLSGDPGVFIRSMASRGAIGGLARKTAAVVQVLDAAGYDLVVVETVGAGQTEVEIASLAQTTLVVESAGMGDDIQAIKAGILEIADILVVNKADRPGADNTFRALRTMIEMAHPQKTHSGHHLMGEVGKTSAISEPAGTEMLWTPPVIKTVSTEKTGINELAGLIRSHAEFLKASGNWKKQDQKRLQSELEALVQAALMENWRAAVPEEVYWNYLARLWNREVSPYQAVNDLVKKQE